MFTFKSTLESIKARKSGEAMDKATAKALNDAVWSDVTAIREEKGASTTFKAVRKLLKYSIGNSVKVAIEAMGGLTGEMILKELKREERKAVADLDDNLPPELLKERRELIHDTYTAAKEFVKFLDGDSLVHLVAAFQYLKSFAANRSSQVGTEEHHDHTDVMTADTAFAKLLGLNVTLSHHRKAIGKGRSEIIG